jgi:exopolysaccharide production protein ExoZ
MVVCFHLAGNLHKDIYFGSSADLLHRIFIFGDAGVPFFFVLSGFIVTWVHQRDFGRPGQLKSYLIKRCVRIYPSYWLIFAATYLAAWLTPGLRNTVPADAAVLIKSLLLWPQDKALTGGTGAPVLFVAWTLQYEMAFYAVIGLAILRQWLVLVPATLFLAHYFWHPFGNAGVYLSFFSNVRIFLFGMGVLVALAARHMRAINRPDRLASMGALGFAAMALTECIWGRDWVPVSDVVLYGLCSALIVLGLIRWEDAGFRLRGLSTLTLTGDASYALYLIHVPVMSLGCKVIMHTGLAGPVGAAIAFVMVLAASVLTAIAFHLYVERPVLNWLTPSKPRANLRRHEMRAARSTTIEIEHMTS